MNGLFPPQKLILDKKDEWKSRINENQLPLTFQHPIHLARKLKLKYSWADALCIVQDSREDQRLELSNMSKVFAMHTAQLPPPLTPIGAVSATELLRSLNSFAIYAFQRRRH
jgi:hypothetical protein